MKSILRNKKGQGLVEYGILVGGIALVGLAATALLGHKVNDLIATTAGVLPCAHTDDAGPIVSGKLVQTTKNEDGALVLNAAATGQLIEDNLGIEGAASMVVEAGHHE